MIKILLLVLVLWMPFTAQALEIVLDGKQNTASQESGSGSLGYIDMEKVFSTFPETRQAKEAFAQKVLEGKNEVRNKEADVVKLRAEIAVLKSLAMMTTGQSLLPGTTAQSAALTMKSQEDKIEEKEILLGQKELDLKDFKESMEENLLSYENSKSQQLMGKIYRVLEELAQEEKLTLIVDKNQIVYGQKGHDLTERVIAKLKQ